MDFDGHIRSSTAHVIQLILLDIGHLMRRAFATEFVPVNGKSPIVLIGWLDLFRFVLSNPHVRISAWVLIDLILS